MKTKDINTVKDMQNYIDGVLNDFEGGIIDKDKAYELIGGYTTRIMVIVEETIMAKITALNEKKVDVPRIIMPPEWFKN